MIILNCDQHRNLSFVDKKYRILQGEHKFDVLKINMPESIDGVDDMQGISVKMHFVSGNEHIDRQVVLENSYISTDIDYTLTEKSKRWLLYLAFYVNVDGEIEIGKTNAVAIQVNKLPYSDTLAKEYKEPEIVLIKGDKGDKGDPGEDGKSAYEIAVEHGYEGTEEEWLSEMKDYNELDNKPRINGHTLSNNQSTDDLGLQGKLTAGQNITISDDNVISAEGGGVTSYNDLTDKPVLRIQTGSTTENITIEDVIKLTPFYKIFGTDIITLDTSRLYSKSIEGISSYTDFDSISNSTRGGVVYCHINAEGIPSFINARDRRFVVYNFEELHDDGCAQLIFWVDNTSGESKSAFRVGTGGLWQASNWVELTGGGSQIVSGVVNANGTITFTDSDGNTFTTTGSSVIGADGFSPVAIVTQTASGATISITDSTGTTTANISNGQDGHDYVLTTQDKSDIADIVLSELPTTQGVLYGN